METSFLSLTPQISPPKSATQTSFYETALPTIPYTNLPLPPLPQGTHHPAKPQNSQTIHRNHNLTGLLSFEKAKKKTPMTISQVRRRIIIIAFLWEFRLLCSDSNYVGGCSDFHLSSSSSVPPHLKTPPPPTSSEFASQRLLKRFQDCVGSGEVEGTGVLRTWGVWYWWFF